MYIMLYLISYAKKVTSIVSSVVTTLALEDVRPGL